MNETSWPNLLFSDANHRQSYYTGNIKCLRKRVE